MDQQISCLPAETVEILGLGESLGQSQTFGLIAGRCSAAQAESLLRLREGKTYLHVAATWKEFCSRFLNISSSQADRMIRLWQQFGPGYFELAQLIRLSEQTYRAIEPSIKDGALHFNDEAIELDPANSEKVVAAVAELRRSLPPREPVAVTLAQRVDALDKRCDAIVAEFAEIARRKGQDLDWNRFELVLNKASAALQRIEQEHGIF